MALDLLVLSGVSLNDETNYVLQEVDFTPPAKKPEWAQSADSDGADLIRIPLYENRTVTLKVQIAPQASKNAALEKVGALVDLLQEAEKNPGGVPLEWTPANATKKITLYVLTGAITEVAMSNEGRGSGWYFGNAPELTVVLTCKPFGYGVETSVAAKSIETGLSTVVLTIPTVEGDVLAEGRLVITDTAAVGRRFVEWGLEQRYYNAATSLILDNESMTPVGGTQSEAANAGAYKPAGTKGTIATTLLAEPTICCNTGVLKHIGTFRVKARVQVVLGASSLAEKVHVRLSYQDGEGPLRANTWQTPNLGGKFVEVDLGEIMLTPAQVGTQKWLGQVEAYSTNAAGTDTLHVDYLTFVPAGEGYGKARGVQSTAAGTVVAFDNFTTGTLSGSLNARTPAVGAAWATSGAVTDWTVEAGAVKRATATDTEPRYGVFGAAQGNSSLATVLSTTSLGVLEKIGMASILRWVDSSNFAFLLLEVEMSALNKLQLTGKLGVKVAGTTTVLATKSEILAPKVLTNFVVRLTATLDGALTAVCGSPIGALAGSHSSIATGGALASGKGGIYDQKLAGAGARARSFSSINVAQLPGIPYCIQPSRSMEVRSDSTIAADPTGVYFGPVPQYRGSRFYVPQDGSVNRTTRLLVKADRNDLEAADQQTIADPFTAQAFWTPRFSVIPRS